MLNWNRSSIRARRTSATAAVAALVCIGLSVLFLVFVGIQESNDAKALAAAGWDRVLPLIKVGHLPAVLPDRKDGKVQEIQVVDAHGRVVAATRHLVGKPPMATFRSTNGDVRAARTLCPPAGLKGCLTVFSYKVYQPDGVWLIYVAVPVAPWYGNSTAVFLAIGASVVITTMVTAGTFRGLTKDLAPVHAIRTKLAEITATGQHRRVPVPRNHDEIKLLAETENAAMDRLENAYQQLRQFTSDASHDLRSPITAMRTQVEEALTYPDDTNWPRTARTVLADIERLQAIVTDLLTLARLDANAPLAREPTNLAQLVSDEVDRRICSRVQIVKDLQPNVAVECDRLRITRVLVNLLDNAERHASSQITVIVRADGLMARLEVIDDGAGIAAEHREKVFERFTRLEDSRKRDVGGTGLGLSIARQIAEAHEGTLTIQDSARGAHFILRLPMCNPVPDR